MRTKESQSHLVKARWALKRQVAAPTILVLLLAVAAFALAVAGMVSDDQALRAATAAGAAGAALGGLIRLRDEVTAGTQARQFWLFFVGQVLVGAAAGVLTFLIDDGGLISVAGGSAGVAAVAFAVGFSEAAFVGLLGRLGRSLAAG
jgi:FtsH-binding integral membrane protein